MASIPEDYGYVLATCGFVGLVQGGLSLKVIQLRQKFFGSSQFKEQPAVQALDKEHRSSFNSGINKMGYPDMGNGRYSQHLTYAQWVQLNNAQRAHYNMIEISAPVLACLVSVGLRHPKLASAFAFLYALGRLIYAAGYTSDKGANGRFFGARVSLIGAIGLALTAINVGLSAKFE